MVRFAVVGNVGPTLAPNFFTMLYPDNWVYLWFAVSGMAAASLLGPGAHGRSIAREVAVLAGISLGVIVHMHMAVAVWVRDIGPRAVLFAAEALAPTLYAAVLLTVVAALFRLAPAPNPYARSPLSGDALVPKDDSEEEVLACVLQHVLLAELGGRLGDVAAHRKSGVGARVKEEYRLLRDAWRRHGLTYGAFEHAFWRPELVRRLTPVGLEDKRLELAMITTQEWLGHVEAGRALRPKHAADAIVFYLVAMAFQEMGVAPPSELRAKT